MLVRRGALPMALGLACRWRPIKAGSSGCPCPGAGLCPSVPIRPSRHDDIYLAPGGDTWHQNQNQLGSHMSSGMVLAVAAIIKAVDQLLDPGRPPAYSRHQRRLCSLALPKTGRTAGISELRDYWRPAGALPLTP